MTKITTLADLRKALTVDEKPIISINEDNCLEGVVELAKVYDVTLPTTKVGDVEYKFTMADADALRQHDANFLEVYGEVTADLIRDAVKENEDIGALELKAEIGNASFTTAFARPTGENVNKKDWAASLGFALGTPKPKALEGKVRKAFATAMMSAMDEEDEE